MKTGAELTLDLMQREGTTPPQLKRLDNRQLAEKLLSAVHDINDTARKNRENRVRFFSSPSSPLTIRNCVEEMLRRCKENPALQEDIYLKNIIQEIRKLKNIHDVDSITKALKKTKLPTPTGAVKHKRFGLF